MSPAIHRQQQVRAGALVETLVAESVAIYQRYWWDGLRCCWRVVQPGGGQPFALLVRQYPPTLGAQGKRILIAKGVTDYFGVLASPAVPIAFDVKSASSMTSFALKPKDQHQLAFIQRVRAFGGFGFFLLVDAKSGWCWVIHEHADLATLAKGGRVTFCQRKQGKPVTHFVTAVQRGLWPGIPAMGFAFLNWTQGG